MLQVPPIFEQLLDAPELSPNEVRVWRAAVRHLDWVELRELKLVVLEHALKLDRATLSRALRTLVEGGFLVRGPALAGQAGRYRVPLSRGSGAKPEPDAGVASIGEGIGQCLDERRVPREPTRGSAPPAAAAPPAVRRRMLSRGLTG